jgi:hypothetical protein
MDGVVVKTTTEPFSREWRSGATPTSDYTSIEKIVSKCNLTGAERHLGSFKQNSNDVLLRTDSSQYRFFR